MIDIVEELGRYRRKIFVVIPEDTRIKQVIYFHGMPGDGREFVEEIGRRMDGMLKKAGACVVMLEAEDWNRDFSPWRAAGVSAGEPDFAGGGKAYLTDLCEEVIPVLEKKYGWGGSDFQRSIGGYSMGGLFALFAVTESSFFQNVISVSGSLWYDGMTEYLSQSFQGKRKELNQGRRAFFSLGKREPKTRNPRMGRVGEQTEVIVEIMEQQGFLVHFQWNPGNHFQNVLERIEQGISYVLSCQNP